AQRRGPRRVARLHGLGEVGADLLGQFGHCVAPSRHSILAGHGARPPGAPARDRRAADRPLPPLVRTAQPELRAMRAAAGAPADVVRGLGGRVVAFASILNRSGGENPFNTRYESLMSLALETYDEANCPSCAAGAALDAPGSRYSR